MNVCLYVKRRINAPRVNVFVNLRTGEIEKKNYIRIDSLCALCEKGRNLKNPNRLQLLSTFPKIRFLCIFQKILIFEFCGLHHHGGKFHWYVGKLSA